ncbi:Cytochrome c oxidase subunit 2 precursor [Jannaschia seosinensis]|uniref:Cytochrome c oxidase subunit 2 n=1 Tax=Jannaschia seosinensis TaxID=313367 RepID=A0A0M7BB24_9RHOB|nr:hypothetical protein [Jannaschia seosinensis]CUH36915.1 Cytochrome c oxidase subunit 2 precursor [Jannaschia seosinensis]
MRTAALFVIALTFTGCKGVQNVLDPASPDARLVAQLGWWMFSAAAFVLIVTLGLLLVALNLYRSGGQRQISFRSSAALVIAGGVVAPVLAIVAVAVSGVAIGDEVEDPGGADGPFVEVAGEIWWWEFRYLDAEGEVIAVTANELHLPVGQRARLQLVSDNVIHSFWALNLQGKTDLIPGNVNTL